MLFFFHSFYSKQSLLSVHLAMKEEGETTEGAS